MKKILVLVFFLASLSYVFPNENVVIERSAFDLYISVNENSYWEWTVPQSPYVFSENYIQFYPGEKLFVEADVIDDIIVKLTVVNEISDESKTITLEFNQRTNSDNPKIHKYMLLVISNPFAKNLEYKANVYLIQNNDWWINTSTIPVRAGLISYEMWPDIIGAIVLYDFILK